MDQFQSRHIGIQEASAKEMLHVLGKKNMDELIDQVIPASIRLKQQLTLAPALSEFAYLQHIQKLAQKNQLFKNYIGLGYFGTVLPSVIQRNILENPGWYTAYTPYQAEIAQGRLEAVLNYQTTIIDLTGLPIANASLLDEATAAAEAMFLLHTCQRKKDAKVLLVDENCLPQTIDVLKTRATPIGIELKITAPEKFEFTADVFACLLQYPNKNGEIKDFTDLIAKAKANQVLVAMAADLLSLTLLKSPGKMGADVAIGTSQRLGIPMGYGGPHAAYFACQEAFKRNIPGRLIGVSIDAKGNPALRMALQTREQHIKREKATSNICTAQVLLSVMAGMYAVYHGATGLRKIAEKIANLTHALAQNLQQQGVELLHKHYFDTLHIKGIDIQKLEQIALAQQINLRYNADQSVCIALDETTSWEDVVALTEIFSAVTHQKIALDPANKDEKNAIPAALLREVDYLQHEVFKKYRSEAELMRYIKKLENKDLSLTRSMIPLGSCTMKLNAATELLPLSWSAFNSMHPFAPLEQAQGYQEMLKSLADDLAKITGFDAVSLQPNSGAQGEYAGLMVIRAYHHAQGNPHRNVALIPASAHGTNPASAAMAGMEIVIVKCDESGYIDIKDLQEKAEKHQQNLACLMVTYPSTHGVFEESITEIISIIHQNGGQVYMDGANMNAQVGLTSPGFVGADVCHLNLHKTFAIPHGGGGPGMGPIGVKAHLAPFLPANPVVKTGGEKAITAVSAAPYGSALVLLISYAYIKMLSGEGLTNATKYAILNANYLKNKLSQHYPILYTAHNGTVAHEMIVDCRGFKNHGIEVVDLAKRLMDYGFHAPTVSFPVAGTLMIEPTESESKAELDRFAEAMIAIRQEIKAVEQGSIAANDSVLKNAPHTQQDVICGEWPYRYTREEAVFPLKWIAENKYWPTVKRINDAHGDRNLICSCLPTEAYE